MSYTYGNNHIIILVEKTFQYDKNAQYIQQNNEFRLDL